MPLSDGHLQLVNSMSRNHAAKLNSKRCTTHNLSVLSRNPVDVTSDLMQCTLLDHCISEGARFHFRATKLRHENSEVSQTDYKSYFFLIQLGATVVQS